MRKKRVVRIKGAVNGKKAPVSFKPWMEEDLAALPRKIAAESLKKLTKLEEQHRAIPLLENLEGCYSIHVHNNKYRIVFEFFEETHNITVWAIGKKDKSYAYNLAFKRREKHSTES